VPFYRDEKGVISRVQAILPHAETRKHHGVCEDIGILCKCYRINSVELFTNLAQQFADSDTISLCFYVIKRHSLIGREMLTVHIKRG
jgi:hypothetical protein